MDAQNRLKCQKQFLHLIANVCALVAVSLILPALAFTGRDSGHGNRGQNQGKQNGHDPIPVVPEANAGWVLIPFFGAVLFFPRWQFTPAKDAISVFRRTLARNRSDALASVQRLLHAETAQ